MPLQPLTAIINPADYQKSAGSWTYNIATGTQSANISATPGATTATITIPIAPEKVNIQFGTEVTSIVVPLRITTANLSSAPTATLYRKPLGSATLAGGVNITPTSVTGTFNGTVTSATTDTAFTFTVTAPAFENLVGVAGPYSYELQLALPCASSTVVYLYETIVLYSQVQQVLV